MNRNDHAQSNGKAKAAGIGTMLLSLLGGIARHVDDVGRCTFQGVDDLARGALHEVDDLGRLGGRAGDNVFCGVDDVLRQESHRLINGEKAATFRPSVTPDADVTDIRVLDHILREMTSHGIRHIAEHDRARDE